MKKTDKIAMNIALNTKRINKWRRFERLTGKYLPEGRLYSKDSDELLSIAAWRKELISDRHHPPNKSLYVRVIMDMSRTSYKDQDRKKQELLNKIHNIFNVCSCKDCPRHKKVRV